MSVPRALEKKYIPLEINSLIPHNVNPLYCFEGQSSVEIL